MGQPPVEVNGFLAAIVVLGIVQGAYSAEIIRGAIEAIPVGQIEAGRAYGMKPFMVLRRVLVPSMLPHVVAGLSNLWLVLVKDSALISVVGYSELLGAGPRRRRRGRRGPFRAADCRPTWRRRRGGGRGTARA